MQRKIAGSIFNFFWKNVPQLKYLFILGRAWYINIDVVAEETYMSIAVPHEKVTSTPQFVGQMGCTIISFFIVFIQKFTKNVNVMKSDDIITTLWSFCLPA